MNRLHFPFCTRWARRSTYSVVKRPAFRGEVALACKDANGEFGNARPPLQVERGRLALGLQRAMFVRNAES